MIVLRLRSDCLLRAVIERGVVVGEQRSWGSDCVFRSSNRIDALIGGLVERLAIVTVWHILSHIKRYNVACFQHWPTTPICTTQIDTFNVTLVSFIFSQASTSLKAKPFVLELPYSTLRLAYLSICVRTIIPFRLLSIFSVCSFDNSLFRQRLCLEFPGSCRSVI